MAPFNANKPQKHEGKELGSINFDIWDHVGLFDVVCSSQFHRSLRRPRRIYQATLWPFLCSPLKQCCIGSTGGMKSDRNQVRMPRSSLSKRWWLEILHSCGINIDHVYHVAKKSMIPYCCYCIIDNIWWKCLYTNCSGYLHSNAQATHCVDWNDRPLCANFLVLALWWVTLYFKNIHKGHTCLPI